MLDRLYLKKQQNSLDEGVLKYMLKREKNSINKH